MKITRNHWILLGIIAVLLLIYYFWVVRKKSASIPSNSPKSAGGESNYMTTCGQNEIGSCVGCIPTTCPDVSDTPGEQSQGCKCDGSGNCLPTCGAGGSLIAWNGTNWIRLPRARKFKRSTATATH